jgi:hypothetical protein
MLAAIANLNDTPSPPRVAELAPQTVAVATSVPAEPLGERRHVTVMFCDLVDSTGIAAERRQPLNNAENNAEQLQAAMSRAVLWLLPSLPATDMSLRAAFPMLPARSHRCSPTNVVASAMPAASRAHTSLKR